ncbi:MFS transporter [Variovorax saccharolyticus]|uniref:MFS transporter n=1 Tax=Variovorax saccharolyticus TaxID=3053516 RepID=UPI0025762F8F|nr:MFS transporter [Variovorax sp. J22R187]MDM0019249.1 MFS transporter [Variovorax sp. J22R187]
MAWKKNPSAVLAGLLFIHLLAHIDRNMLLGFSPQIIADLGISNAQYGFLVGAVWVMSFGVMALFLGSLADRFSRTRIIAAGVFIWSLCTWASGHAQSFEQMALARFFVASGEAALVPAAVSLLTELFPEKRRGTVMGVFFMGIPMGIGVSFLLAGTFGAAHGWRSTFYTLGVAGVVIALLLSFLKDDRSNAPAHERGAPFVLQVRTVLGQMRQRPALLFLIVGFVLIHVLFAGLSFTQLWLVQERGLDAASIASRIGALQLLFGALGAVVGGVVGDRLARRIPGGHAGVIVLFIALCAVPMIAYRFVAPGSWLFYLGMCAGFFLPLGSYGPANAAIMGMVPPQTRSTVSGFTMLCINILAIAVANLVAGRAVDVLIAQGVSSPLTHVVLATDVVGIGSIFFFALAALFSAGQRAGRGTAPTAAVQPVADTAR